VNAHLEQAVQAGEAAKAGDVELKLLFLFLFLVLLVLVLVLVVVVVVVVVVVLPQHAVQWIQRPLQGP